MSRIGIRTSLTCAAALLALPMAVLDSHDGANQSAYPLARATDRPIAATTPNSAGKFWRKAGKSPLGSFAGLFGGSSPRATGVDPTGGLRTVINTISAEGCGGRIGDRVWHDFDKNGIQDDGEKGLPGITVVLLNGSRERLDMTTTNASGNYAFGGLCDGDYFVLVVESTLPGGFNQTPTLVGRDPTIDNDPSPTLVTLTGDTDSDGTRDFGYQCSRTDLDEGCTPGYWRQRQHFDSWSYDPYTLFSDVFEDAFPGKTLLQVVSKGGGGLKALGRHTVAALLNSTATGVGYNLSQSEVVNAFNDAYPGSKNDYENVKNGFEALNELGCPLN
jgi:hypothetical protein